MTWRWIAAGLVAAAVPCGLVMAAWWAQRKEGDDLAFVNQKIADNTPSEKKFATFEPALRERSDRRRAKADKARVEVARIDSGVGYDGDIAAAVRARGTRGVGRDGSRGWRSASSEAGIGAENQNTTPATRAGLHVRAVPAGVPQRGGASAAKLLRHQK